MKIKQVKVIYSEKATKCDEISIFVLTLHNYLINVKNKMEILSNCVALSQYMNFICLIFSAQDRIRLNK